MASFVGPLIASKAFFTGQSQYELTNVQYVYLAVACAGAAVAVLFFFAKLPEVEEQAVRSGSVVDESTLELGVDQYGNVIGEGPLYKQYNMIFGFIAQFCYVGAQVSRPWGEESCMLQCLVYQSRATRMPLWNSRLMRLSKTPQSS